MDAALQQPADARFGYNNLMTNTSSEWQPQAVIFDMDGLLVDSSPAWERAETDLVESRGFTFDLAVRAQIVGLRMDTIIATFAGAYQLTENHDALIAELEERMLAAIPEAVIAKPGARELIAYLVESDVPRAIASSSPLPIIDAIVRDQGWLDAFPLRCSADSVPHGKPAPDVYLMTAQQLGVDPEKCLALEDSVTGARAAVAAGMVCYAVPDVQHVDPVKFAGVTPHVFESLHDVLRLLRG